MATKKCSKCGIERDISEFNKDERTNIKKRGKDGLRSSCKYCDQEYNKQYRKTHKEEDKLYREKNKEKLQEYAKEYRSKLDKNKVKEYNQNYYVENKSILYLKNKF
jgi:hypothetical protein